MPLAHESQYYLDCAYECLDNTADIATWIYLTDYDLDATLAMSMESNPDIGYLTRYTERIKSDFDSWRLTASNLDLAYVESSLILQSYLQWQEFCFEINDELGDEAIDNRVNDTISYVQDLDNIQRIIRSRSRYTKFLDEFKTGIEYFNRSMTKITTTELLDKINYERQRYNNRFVETHPDFNFSSQSNIKSSIKTKKVSRSPLNKSMKTLSSFIGYDKVRSFVSGDGFWIDGDHLKYKFSRTKNISILASSINPGNIHIPYTLSVYDEDVYLFDLCIVVQNTPILDQILAIILMIKSGEEHVILETGNPYNRQDALVGNTKIKDLAPKHFRSEINRSSLNNFIGFSDEDMIYHERLTQQVMPLRVHSKSFILRGAAMYMDIEERHVVLSSSLDPDQDNVSGILFST